MTAAPEEASDTPLGRGEAEGGTASAEEVVGHGSHYADISASDSRLRKLEGLDALASRRDGRR